jgi:leucyl aminopeptidase (aminopeptidase T)
LTKSSGSAIGRTATKLLKNLMKVQDGETVAITCDTESDWAFALEVEKAAAGLGAKPLLLRNAAPPHVGRAADPFLPLESLGSAVASSDVWIELNGKWLLYSSVYEQAIKAKKTRYICLVGMNRDMAVRCVGNVDVPKVLEFQRVLQRITERARSMHYTTPAGTDVSFENDPKRPVLVEGDVSGPGEYMLLGQVDWAPLEESISGTIVYDGSVNPPDDLGLLEDPLRLRVREGRITSVESSQSGRIYQKWLKSLGDDNMYTFAHLSYGCNPGAKLTGNVLEDERIWGVLEWGIGNQSESFKAKNTKAISHSDGITLNPTLEADGELIIRKGRYVHPELVGPKSG